MRRTQAREMQRASSPIKQHSPAAPVRGPHPFPVPPPPIPTIHYTLSPETQRAPNPIFSNSPVFCLAGGQSRGSHIKKSRFQSDGAECEKVNTHFTATGTLSSELNLDLALLDTFVNRASSPKWGIKGKMLP